MAKMKMNTDVNVMDEEICEKCKHFKIKQNRTKRIDAYGFEVEEINYQCANKELCEYLVEFISKERFLSID